MQNWTNIVNMRTKIVMISLCLRASEAPLNLARYIDQTTTNWTHIIKIPKDEKGHVPHLPGSWNS